MPTPTVLLLAGLIAAGTLGALAIIFTRLLGNGPASASPLQPPAAPLRLQPMHRLLAADDFAFLGRQPGFHSQVAAKLRARRVSIFKTYLNSLETEFSRLHRALRLLTLVAGHDRPEIAQLLLEQRVQFTFRLWDARIRLALFGFGVRPADLSGVADAIQQLRERVQILQAPLQSAPMTA